MQKRLILRTDANTKIGRGHLSRCLAIASMLKKDIDILFVFFYENKKYISESLVDFNCKYINNDDDLYQLINQDDLFWIDGYNFTENWKRKIQQQVYKLIETNDIPYHSKYVDVLFNHTPGINRLQYISKNTECYLGLKYALLRSKFLVNTINIKPQLSGNGVFICFGGADPFNLGYKIVSNLIKNNFSDPIYWVTNNTEYEACNDHYNINHLSNLTEDGMISYMTEAKVLLIPSSVLSIEAIALRKPVYTCYFVNNQKLIYNGLLSSNLVSGSSYIETDDDIENTVVGFLKYYCDVDLHKQQIENQTKILDRKSTSRIIKIINNM
jgi:spore coat polysaccharide biosynthesis predicted glycosyltransferase SpsG